MTLYADYQVLAMTAEKGASFYSECPYVSDELWHHPDAMLTRP